MYLSYLNCVRLNGDASIERDDNNIGYCLENCRWIKKNEQSKNRRFNHSLKYGGKLLTLADLSKKVGIPYDSLRSRIIRKGMGIKESIEQPFRLRTIPITQMSLDGEIIKKWSSIKEASKCLGLDDGGISRASRGLSSNCGGYLWENCANKTGVAKDIEIIRKLEE